MQTESEALKDLLQINQTLSRRVRSGDKFYVALVVAVSLFMMIFWGVPLFTNWIDFTGEEEMRLSFSISVFLLVSLDVLLTLLRAQSSTLIEPYHLVVFPLGERAKRKFDFILLLTDYRSVVYCAVGLTFVLYFLKEFSVLSAALSLVLVGAFYVAVTAWALVFLALLRRILGRARSSVMIVFFLLLIFYNAALMTKETRIFLKIPIVSYLGDGLYALKRGDLQSALLGLLLLGVMFGFGILFLGMTPRRD